MKFRTLISSAPKYSEKCSDAFYTKIGFFLRKTHLDELPQLFNIFVGQMSFFGPRPIILSLENQIKRRIQDETILLRPGLSGLAQIMERDKELTQEEKCEFDKIYLANISFAYDFKLLLKTISAVFVNSFRKKPAKVEIIELMYITNQQNVALVAEEAGVNRIWIDLETIGKEERQAGMNSVKSHHSFDDIKKIAPILTKAKMQVRINPWHEGSSQEIEKAISYGAQYIMLPMWKTAYEIKSFLKVVNQRCKTILLLETKEAENCLDSVLKLKGIDEIHIGLNDLHLSYKLKFMFELLANGTVDRIAKKIKKHNIPFGFGGFSYIGDGLIPSEMILEEHYRLGSKRAILSRGFCNIDPNNPSFKSTFIKNVQDIRFYEKSFSNTSKSNFIKNHKKICYLTKKIVEGKNE